MKRAGRWGRRRTERGRADGSCERDGSEAREKDDGHGARRCTWRERPRRDDSVTGSDRSGKRAEHAHAAVASQSRRGARGSRFPHFVALIRFERVVRERASVDGGGAVRRVVSRRAPPKIVGVATVSLVVAGIRPRHASRKAPGLLLASVYPAIICLWCAIGPVCVPCV